jgi:hypothetical protein
MEMLHEENIVNELPRKKNNHNVKFDQNPIKFLLVGIYFSLTNLEGFIITIYLLVVGSYLPSFTYYGMKQVK